MKRKVLGIGLKGISVLNSTLVGTGLMSGEKMSAIPYNTEIGIGAGLLLGSLTMFGVSQLEEKKQILPILVITGLLASTYQYSAPAIHKLMLSNELNKITYNYNDYKDTLKNDPNYHYDREKNQLLYRKYREVFPESELANKYSDKIATLQKNKELFISKKYKELVNGKYDKKGHRTSWYNKQVSYALSHNWKNIEVGSSISKKELQAGKTDLALMAIAEIFYYDALNRLEKSKSEYDASIKAKKESYEVQKAFKDYNSTTKDYILAIRANLQKKMAEELQIANSKIYSEEDISEVMKIIGVIVEIILTPFLMWLSILENLPTHETIIKNWKEWRRKNKTKEALESANDEVLVNNLDDLLKKHNLKLTKELKRILFLVEEIMHSDLNFLSENDLKPKVFATKYGSRFPKDIQLPNYKKDFQALKKFMIFFKNNFISDSSKRTTEDILYAFAEYKNSLKR